MLIALLAATALSVAQAQIVDDTGRTLQLPGPAQRIVSLSPGATALLFAAGAGARIVATTEFSTEPAAAAAIARIGDSAHFDAEAILALHPSVVVVWIGGTPEAQIERLERLGLPVYRHRLARLDDIPAAVRRFGALGGTESVAAVAAASLEQRIARLRTAHGSRKGRVLIEVWNRPIYTVGRNELLTDALDACGYENVFGDIDASAPAVSLESVLARDPDAIVALGATPEIGAQWLEDWRRYPTLKAARNGRLLEFSDQRFSRLGPGTIDALETLCHQLDISSRAALLIGSARSSG